MEPWFDFPTLLGTVFWLVYPDFFNHLLQRCWMSQLDIVFGVFITHVIRSSVIQINTRWSTGEQNGHGYLETVSFITDGGTIANSFIGWWNFDPSFIHRLQLTVPQPLLRRLLLRALGKFSCCFHPNTFTDHMPIRLLNHKSICLPYGVLVILIRFMSRKRLPSSIARHRKRALGGLHGSKDAWFP